MNAWIKCPTCGGVLKAQPGVSEGPCVFCETVLRVNVQVAVVSGEGSESEIGLREVGGGSPLLRTPLPKLTRSGKSV